MLMSKFHYGDFFRLQDFHYIINLSWILTYLIFINEKLFLLKKKPDMVKYLLYKFCVFISLSAILFVFLNLDDISRSMFVGSSLIFLIFKLLLLNPYNYLIKKRKRGQYFSKILVAGAGKAGKSILSYYRENNDLGEIVGFLSNGEIRSNGIPVLGHISEFQQVFEKRKFNELIITLDMSHQSDISTLIRQAEYNGVRPRVIADYNEMFKRHYEVRKLGKIPVINIRECPLTKYYNRFWKRAFDIIFASLMLIISLPFFFLIAIAIKLESRGPIFYMPLREGKRGEKFTLIKFRSMKQNDDPINGIRSTDINDERITKVGKIIRKLNLDELPQFINVLKNEMSVVGPRPHRIKLNQMFQKDVSSYMVRYYVKPGITGWAQVNGWRGPSISKYQKKARTLYDLWYVEHWNFGLDLYIIFLTVFNVKSYMNNN